MPYDRKDGLLGLGIAILFGLLCLGYVSAKPQLFQHEDFVYRDSAFPLGVADDLNQGKTLFKDVFWQYGPLPIRWFAGFGRVFGVSPLSFFASLSLVYGLALGLFWLAVRRNTSRRVATLLTGGIAAPGLLYLTGGPRIYEPFEMVAVFGLCLAYELPKRRSMARWLLYGVILAGMQWIKFGGAFVLGGALLATDILALVAQGDRSRKNLIRWIGGNLLTLAVFLFSEAIRWGLYRASLPAEIATDAFFPSYILDSYGAGDGVILQFESWGYLAGRQWPIIAMLGIAVVGVFAGFLRPSSHTTKETGACCIERSCFVAMLPLAFFLLGVAVYFKHNWLIYQYVWTLILPASIGLVHLPGRARALGVVALLPFLLMAPYKFIFQDKDREEVVMPSGDRVWLYRNDRDDLEHLVEALVPLTGGGRKVMAFDVVGSGLQHYYGIPLASRHQWLLPGFVRPHEEAAMLDAIEKLGAVVVKKNRAFMEAVTEDPESWRLENWTTLDAHFNNRLLERLSAPTRVGDTWLVFPVNQDHGELSSEP